MRRFSTKMVAVMGVLIAMEIVIARFGTFRPAQSMKLSLDFIPIAAAAILYGPVPAAVIGALADILGAVLFPAGTYFPGFTLTAILTGLLYGFFLYKGKNTFRAALAKLLSRLFGKKGPDMICVVLAVLIHQWILSLFLNTLWLKLLYHWAYWPTLVSRLVQCAVMTAIEIALIPAIAEAVRHLDRPDRHMTAAEAVAYIERHTWSETRLGLGRTRELLHALGDPQKELKFVHVAGSNGKGSTCAMLDAVLRAAGCRTGLYTSPYIEEFSERIRVDGENIPGDRLAALTEWVAAFADAMEDHPSQFELVTAVAMEYFHECGCDIVVLEVGMGGELDSTNVIDAPEAAVITNIGLEHTEYLGGTLEKIAAAKAGIIKPGCACVLYDGAPEVTEVVRETCRERDVPLTVADFSRLRAVGQSLRGQDITWDGEPYRLALLGAHQLKNAAVALTTVEVLRERGFAIGDEAVRAGLRDVKWPARLEVLNESPLFFLDGGHNPQCAEALAEALGDLLPGKRAVFLTGVLADKDYPAMLETVEQYASEFFCLTPDSGRALPAEELAAYLNGRGIRAAACVSAENGVRAALDAAGEDGAVVAFGSLYMAGAIRRAFPGVYRDWLRRKKIAARDGLTPQERDELSGKLARRLTESPEFQRAKTVMLYRAVRGEARVDAVEAAGGEKRIAYPLCLPDGRMEARVPAGPDAWRTGRFGIQEPDPARSELVPPEEIDLVICPCTAFDEACGRMGMGGGYYDRFLPDCGSAAAFAAAFEVQKAQNVPMAAWDRPMDAVFTEAAAYRREL